VDKLRMGIFKSVLIVFTLSVLLPATGALAQDGVLNFNKATVEALIANEDL